MSLKNCCFKGNQHSITKARLYNVDPLKPHFYIVKLGFTGVYIIFLISAQNIDCGYSLEPPRRGGSNEYPQSMFWAEIWKNIRVFYVKIFSFCRWNFLYICIGVFLWWTAFCSIWTGSAPFVLTCLSKYFGQNNFLSVPWTQCKEFTWNKHSLCRHRKSSPETLIFLIFHADRAKS